MHKSLLLLLLMSSSLYAMEAGVTNEHRTDDSLAMQSANDARQRMQRDEEHDYRCLQCFGAGCVVCAGISCYECPLPTGCFLGGTAVLMAIVCARHGSNDVVECLREIFPCISGVRREKDD